MEKIDETFTNTWTLTFHIPCFGVLLIKKIGKKIQEATGEKLSTFYLMQSISMAIQQGNTASIRV